MSAEAAKLRRPCSNCPWRVDAPRGYWDPQHFVDIWRNCQDDGANIMLCHFQPTLSQKKIAKRKPSSGQPPEATPNALPKKDRDIVPCQGWIRVMGFSAIGVSLLALQDKIAHEEVEDRGGPALFPTFTAMLRANEIRLPGRSRQTPRRRRRRDDR